MTIFSHVNPAHEKRIAEICREEIEKAGVEINVYTSHEVRPVIREQSRLNSVLIEAYATSRGRQQLKGIEDVSKKYGFKYGVQTLLSFGGLTSINHPRLHETMISGPIGGILGAAYVGKLIGNDSLICSDMGGTSFDMGVITRGQTRIENEPLMDRFKLNVPTLHLDTIGAGAGMILKVDPLTRKVSLGPESAGADPGPICFDRGGTEPTIADCDAILGRLNPHYFLGGKVEAAGREGAPRLQGKMRRLAWRRRRGGGRRHDRHAGGRRQQRAAPRHLRPGHPSVGVHAALLWRLRAAAPCRLRQGHRLQGHHHLPVRRRVLGLRLHHRRLHAPPFGVDTDRHSATADDAALAAFGAKVTASGTI